jgi:hypothetical protein
MLAKHIIVDFPRFFEGASTQKSLVPLEIFLKLALTGILAYSIPQKRWNFDSFE